MSGSYLLHGFRLSAEHLKSLQATARRTGKVCLALSNLQDSSSSSYTHKKF